MSTHYLGRAALDRIDTAQAGVDRHVAAGPDGRCLTCGQEHPCPDLRTAALVFTRYARLPRRRPGLASRGVRRAPAFGWLDPPPAGTPPPSGPAATPRPPDPTATP